MKKTILVFGALIIALLTLFQISKFSITSGGVKTELVISIVAILSFVIGAYFNKKSRNSAQKEPIAINHQKIKDLEITAREYEVLQAISQGFSNKEIANKLFLSESTIKTHVSNVLVKLNAKRRTQAVQIAKEINII